MAREIDSRTFERQVDEVCPSDGCPGVLARLMTDEVKNLKVILCNSCGNAFPMRYSLPMSAEDRNGYVLEVNIPNEALMSLAVSLWTKNVNELNPNPADRQGFVWEELESHEQTYWINNARKLLTPIWADISSWFEGIAYLQERGRAAMDALTEIAIPSLKYCEGRYGHDDQARLNIEAAIRRTE